MDDIWSAALHVHSALVAKVRLCSHARGMVLQEPTAIVSFQPAATQGASRRHIAKPAFVLTL